MALDITLPIGRLVQGNPFHGETKHTFGTKRGQPRTDKQGNPTTDYFFAVAIPKTDAAWPAIHAQIKAEGTAAWPGGQSLDPKFAWKIVDGDLPANADKEGFPGHWIVRCNNGFPPGVFKFAGGAFVAATRDELKLGDYVSAAVQIVGSNNTPSNPGIFINGVQVCLRYPGEEIVAATQDPRELFGTTVPPPPPGAKVGTVAPATDFLNPGAPATVPPVAPATVPPVAPATVPPVAPATVPAVWALTPAAVSLGLTQLGMTNSGMTEEAARKGGLIS